MRGSGWLLAGAALLLWLGAVAFPSVGIIEASVLQPGPQVQSRATLELLFRSAGWAAAAAIGAVILGWAPGRLLGRALRGRGYVPLATAMLVPICLPGYLVFYVWWQAWPADSSLYRWAVEHGQVSRAKAATLFIGLVAWSWPMVAWCVGAAAGSSDAARTEELLALDGASSPARVRARLHGDGRGLCLGAVIVFLLVFGSTTSFHIAQIYTFGFELRAMADLRAGPRSLLVAALPAIVVAGSGVAATWLLLERSRPVRAAGGGHRAGAVSIAATAVIWLVTALLPLVLFSRGLARWASVGDFVAIHGRSLANTVAVAAAAGAGAALVAVGLAAFWQDQRRTVRMLGHAQAIGWLGAALVPGPLVAAGFEAAYNRPVLDRMVYSTPLILVLGLLARYAFVGVLVARWLARQEPRSLADSRALDGATTLPGLLESSWPRLLASGAAAAAIAAVLSVGDLSVTGALCPPGLKLIAPALLEAVHYQDPETVMLGALVIGALAIAAGLVVCAVWVPLRGALPPAFAALLLVGGCGRGGDEGRPLRPIAIFGSSGLSLGQFNYPRALCVDQARGVFYVVDKTARVQRFGLDGAAQIEWRMPEWANGKPTGISVAPDGRVFVADTHYHRIMVYDSDGRECFRFGSYGEGPGQFIYPTDVAFGPHGRIYVSEYGGNDRIQVFDAVGVFLFSFGGPGQEPGTFNRPQSMVFSADGAELYVADACNHRISVLDPEGRPLRTLGAAGRGAAQLAYPYDVEVLDDGTLLVCEFGNNRIQRLAPGDGRCLGYAGRMGMGEGELRFPWSVGVVRDSVYVLDSGNNRVQVVREF